MALGSGASTNLVQGNYIGTNAAGTAALPNENGIHLFDAHNNTIGGNTATARNVISGNRFNGLQIEASNSNVVQSNFVGTNAAGDAAIDNTSENIRIAGSNNTLVGGPTATPGAAPGNVIANMFIVGGVQTLVQGSLLGLNAAGAAKINAFPRSCIEVWGRHNRRRFDGGHR